MPKKATEAVLTVKVNVDTSEINELSKEIKESYDEINQYSKNINIKTKGTFQNLIKTLKKEYANINFSDVNKKLSNALFVATDSSDIEEKVNKYISSIENFQSYLKDNNLSQKLFDGVDSKAIEQYITLVNKLNDSLSDVEQADLNSKLTSFNDKLLLRYKNIYKDYNVITRGQGIDSSVNKLEYLQNQIFNAGDQYDPNDIIKYVQYLKKAKELFNSLPDEAKKDNRPALEEAESFYKKNLLDKINDNSTLNNWFSSFNAVIPYFDKIENLLLSEQKIEIDIDDDSRKKIQEKLKDIFGTIDIDLSKIQFHNSDALDPSEVGTSADNFGAMSAALFDGEYQNGGKYNVGFGTLSGTALYLQSRLNELKTEDLEGNSTYVIDLSKIKNTNLFRPKSENDALSFAKAQANLQSYVIQQAYENSNVARSKNVRDTLSALQKGYTEAGSPNLDQLFENLEKSYYGNFITKDEFNKFVTDFISQYKNYIEASPKDQYEIGLTDNITAALNKKLGYNGVDVSGYVGLDNFRQGSGVYQIDENAIIAEYDSIEKLEAAFKSLWKVILSLEDTNIAKWFKDNVAVFQDPEFQLPNQTQNLNDDLLKIVQPESSSTPSSTIEVQAELSNNAKQQLKDGIEKVADELSEEDAVVTVSVGAKKDSEEEKEEDSDSKEEGSQESSGEESKEDKSDDKDPKGKAKLDPELSETFKEDAEKLIADLHLESTVTLSPVLSEDYNEKVADLIGESKNKSSDSTDESSVEANSEENSKSTLSLNPELVETFKADAEAAVKELDLKSPITLYPDVPETFEADAKSSMPDLTLPVTLSAKDDANEDGKNEDSNTAELKPKLSDDFKADAEGKIKELGIEGQATLNPALSEGFITDANAKVDDADVTGSATLYPYLSTNFKDVADDKLSELNINVPVNLEIKKGKRSLANTTKVIEDSLGNEFSSFDKISDSIERVTAKIGEKNAAIQEENNLVDRVAAREVWNFIGIKENIQRLIVTIESLKKLTPYIEELQSIGDTLSSLKINPGFAAGLKGLVAQLDKLGTKLEAFGQKNIEFGNLKTLSEIIPKLRISEKSVKAIDSLQDSLVDLSDVLRELQQADGGSYKFLDQLSTLVAKSKELEHLAKIIANYETVTKLTGEANPKQQIKDQYSAYTNNLKELIRLKKEAGSTDDSERIKLLNNEIRSLSTKNQWIRKNIAALLQENPELETAIQNEKNTVSTLEKKLEIQKDLNKLVKENRKQEEAKAQQESADAKDKSDVDGYYKKLKDNLAEIKKLTTSRGKETNEDNRQTLQDQIDAYTKENTKIKESINTIYGRNSALKTSMAVEQNKIDLLENEITTIEKLSEETRKQQEATAQKTKTEETDKSDLTSYYKKLKDNLAEIKKLTTDQGKQSSEVKRKILQDQIDAYEKENTKINESIEGIYKRNSALKSSMAVEENKVAILNDEIATIQKLTEANREEWEAKIWQTADEENTRRTDTEVAIQEDSDGWKRALKVLQSNDYFKEARNGASSYLDLLYDIQSITAQIRRDDRTGEEYVSYKFTDSLGSSLTVGANGDLLIQKSTVLDLKKAYSELISLKKDYDKIDLKARKGVVSDEEVRILREYSKLLDQVETEYRDGGWGDGSAWKKNASIGEVESDKIQRIIKSLQQLRTEYQALTVYEKGTSDTKIEKFLNKVYTFMGNNTKAAKLFRTELESLIGTAKAAGKNVNLDELMDQFLEIENAASSNGLMGSSFLDDFKKQANYTLSNFLAQYLSIQDIIRYAQSAISTIEGLDYALLDLSKTAAMTESQLDDFYFSANDSAKALGVTTESIIDLASSWSRLGYNTNEAATEMAEMTAKFAAISPGTSTDEAQTGLINIMKAWGLQADQMEDIIDKVNVLGKGLPKRMATYGALKCA